MAWITQSALPYFLHLAPLFYCIDKRSEIACRDFPRHDDPAVGQCPLCSQKRPFSRRALSALHAAGPDPTLRCCPEFVPFWFDPIGAANIGDNHERYRPSAESKRTVCQDV